MNDTTRVASGQSAGWSGDASRVPGLADALFGYAEVARAMVWSIESTRMALDFNRALLDIGRDVLRRQQDAAIASALQALGGAATPPDQEAVSANVSDLMRQSFDAFDRMMAAMRAASTVALRTANQGPSAAAGVPSADPEGRAASR